MSLRHMGEWRFLTSALDGGEWSASSPGHFIPGERTPGSTQWIGGWVGPRAGLDTVTKRLAHLPGIKPWSSSP